MNKRTKGATKRLRLNWKFWNITNIRGNVKLIVFAAFFLLQTVSNGPPHNYQHRPSKLQSWLPRKKKRIEYYCFAKMSIRIINRHRSDGFTKWSLNICAKLLPIFMQNWKKKLSWWRWREQNNQPMSPKVWWLHFSINYTQYKNAHANLTRILPAMLWFSSHISS